MSRHLRMAVGVTAAAAAVAVLTLFLLSREEPAAVGAPRASVPATAGPADPMPSPSLSAIAAAPSEPQSSPVAGEPTSATGVIASPLGTLEGNWIFFAQLVPSSISVTGTLEVWAIDPTGRQRPAFSYPVSIGGVPEDIRDVNAYLRRQFSPDGRQVVVAGPRGLVIVDLESGRTRRIAAGGVFPSWSKDGKTIAYIATVSQPDPNAEPPEQSIWVVPVTGGTPREVVRVGFASISPEWSEDSRLLMAGLKNGVGLISVATGNEVMSGRILGAEVMTGAHWRRDARQVVVTVVRRDDTQVVIHDRAGLITQTVVQYARSSDDPACCPKVQVPSDPRWNPTGSGEVLFLVLDERANRTELKILDTRSGQTSHVLDRVAQATWSADGRQVVYIVRTEPGMGASIRALDRATGADREIVAAPASRVIRTSIVSVSY